MTRHETDTIRAHRATGVWSRLAIESITAAVRVYRNAPSDFRFNRDEAMHYAREAYREVVGDHCSLRLC